MGVDPTGVHANRQGAQRRSVRGSSNSRVPLKTVVLLTAEDLEEAARRAHEYEGPSALTKHRASRHFGGAAARHADSVADSTARLGVAALRHGVANRHRRHVEGAHAALDRVGCCAREETAPCRTARPPRGGVGLHRESGMHDPRERFLIRYAGGFAPLTVARASGSWVETADGRRILDVTSGQICSTVGHNHPRIAAAIRSSLDEVVHLTSWMLSEPVLALGERLAGLAPDPLDRVMLLNTGSEANEVAVKLAKLATGRFEVVGLARSFHGLLAGSGSITYSMGHAGYGPLVPGSLAVPAPYAYRCPIRHCEGTCDCTCLEAGFDLVDQQSVGSLCALVVEPVLSAGGIIVPPPGYFMRALELCRERGMLLVMDEAQTGFGRLGAMFGFELDGIVPDLLAASKTLGGGVPLAATIAPSPIEEAAVANGFLHVTSHVSDPLPAAAGLAVLDVIEEDGLVARATERGDHLMRRLGDLQHEHEQIGEIRGRGLLVGVELVRDRDTREPADALGAAVTDECLRCGLSMNIVRSGQNANCLRMAPPLSVTDDEIDTAVEILDAALRTSIARAGREPLSAR